MELVEIRDYRDVPLFRAGSEADGQVEFESHHDAYMLAPEQAEELARVLLDAAKAARGGRAA